MGVMSFSAFQFDYLGSYAESSLLRKPFAGHASGDWRYGNESAGLVAACIPLHCWQTPRTCPSSHATFVHP